MYRKRKGERKFDKLEKLKKILNREDKKLNEEGKPKVLLDLPYNILAEILNFTEVNEVAYFSSTCKQAYSVSNMSRIWKNHYYCQYKLYSPMVLNVLTKDTEYKNLCIKGFEEKNRRLKLEEKPIIPESIRDEKIGLRFIICEECLYSLLRLPHLLCMPLKGLVKLLPVIRTHCTRGVKAILHNKKFALSNMETLIQISPLHTYNYVHALK